MSCDCGGTCGGQQTLKALFVNRYLQKFAAEVTTDCEGLCLVGKSAVRIGHYELAVGLDAETIVKVRARVAHGGRVEIDRTSAVEVTKGALTGRDLADARLAKARESGTSLRDYIRTSIEKAQGGGSTSSSPWRAVTNGGGFPAGADGLMSSSGLIPQPGGQRGARATRVSVEIASTGTPKSALGIAIHDALTGGTS